MAAIRWFGAWATEFRTEQFSADTQAEAACAVGRCGAAFAGGEFSRGTVKGPNPRVFVCVRLVGRPRLRTTRQGENEGNRQETYEHSSVHWSFADGL